MSKAESTSTKIAGEIRKKNNTEIWYRLPALGDKGC